MLSIETNGETEKKCSKHNYPILTAKVTQTHFCPMKINTINLCKILYIITKCFMFEGIKIMKTTNAATENEST
jgi:hypothetical protein